MAESYGEYCGQQGGLFDHRVFDAAVVGEALTKIEAWRDDQGAKNDWARSFISYHVMGPLTEALKKNPALITPPVWERLKGLLKHPEPQVSHGMLSPLREIARLNRKFAGDVNNVLTDLIRNAEDPELRDAGIDLLCRIASEYKNPAMIEEAFGVFAGALGDPSPKVRRIAVDRMESLTLYDGIDPARAMTILAPAMKDKDGNVRTAAVTDIIGILRKSLIDIDSVQAGTLRALFQEQAAGAKGWRNRDLRSGVKDVLDTFDFYKGLIDAAHDAGDPQAQIVAGEKLGIFTGLLQSYSPVKVVEYLAPLLKDERPIVRGWAVSNAEDQISTFGQRMKPDDLTRLRDIFTVQAKATHWWERDVRSGQRLVLEALKQAEEKAAPQP